MKNNKKEIITIILSCIAAMVVIFLFHKTGGYTISMMWKWELFVLLLAQVLAMIRTFFGNGKLLRGFAIDISILFVLMVGYLINFEDVEFFVVYDKLHIIFSRLFIIILYYLICRLVGMHGKSVAGYIAIVVVQWISIFNTVIIGGSFLEYEIYEMDGYADTTGVLNNIVNYYCLPQEKVFWIGSIVTWLIIAFVSYKIYRKSQEIYGQIDWTLHLK